MFTIKDFSSPKLPNQRRSVHFKRLNSDEKNTSAFKPHSRYEKIIQASGNSIPKSTEKRIVFCSNTNANGFINQRSIRFPADIAVQKMKEEIDLTCYKVWKQNKQFLERDLFDGEMNFIKIITMFCFLVITILFVCLLYGYLQIGMVYGCLVICMIIGIGCAIGSVLIFNKDNLHFDLDKAMINAIKNKLAQFNMRQKQLKGDGIRYQWRCDKHCLWISIELYKKQVEIQDISS